MRGEDEARRPWQADRAGEDGGDYTADPGVSETRPQGLRARLDEARQSGSWSMGDLSVLSARKDPYRLDTPSFHRDGAWLADQVARLALRLPVHLRGLHYALVASASVVKPDGNPYTNTDADWTWLQEVAAKAARWLNYVPFSAIIDNRNEAPLIFVPDEVEPRSKVYCSFTFDLPDPDLLEPIVTLRDFEPRQPFRICLCGEKASLAPVLRPLAEEYQAELVLPTGEMSDTLIAGIASRASADGRPLVVLYFADFDPAGWQMPISVARKLQAMGELMPELPPVEVHRVAMTRETGPRPRSPFDTAQRDRATRRPLARPLGP